MLPEIKEQTKKDFEAAAIKLDLTTELPDLSILRPDLALYLTAVYMAAVLYEAKKDGNEHDITNHKVKKYEALFTADEGYVPGSSGGGFSCSGCDSGRGFTCVGARLSSNSWEDCKEFAEKYVDLWEIIMLLVK